MHLLRLDLARLTLFMFLVMMSTVNKADSLKSLLMPGPVIESHAKFEQECIKCHDTDSKAEQGKICVSCHSHEDILDDLTAKTGFHGRLPKSTQNDCKHCHTEHKGRSANVVPLNASTFDHTQTDFLLKGAHEKATCSACHKPEKKHSEAPSDCYSCHKKSDAHDGKQGKKCGDCHKTSNWKKTGFDHDDTDFPLKGEHKKTTCTACHLDQKYKDTEKACYSCHQINDAHNGGFGKKCDRCHNPEKWDKISFDHNKETDFSLYGKHKTAACDSCHKPDDLKTKESKKKIPKDCFGCHKNDDSHKSQYGKKCDTCHTSSSWQKQKFDHDKTTDFPLLGKHQKVACNQCHKTNLYDEKTSTKCVDCHKKDDVHKGKQGEKCDSCHNEKGWSDKVLFDHDLTSFPLIGMHATSQCEECHLTSVYGDTKSGCNYCHSGDDVHKTKLGTDCETCHNPNSWGTWLFDHNKNTDFIIDGAHKDVGCYDCHRTESAGSLQVSKDCIYCHQSHDIHNRQFGRHCDNCHSTESFKDANIKKDLMRK